MAATWLPRIVVVGPRRWPVEDSADPAVVERLSTDWDPLWKPHTWAIDAHLVDLPGPDRYPYRHFFLRRHGEEIDGEWLHMPGLVVARVHIDRVVVDLFGTPRWPSVSDEMEDVLLLLQLPPLGWDAEHDMLDALERRSQIPVAMCVAGEIPLTVEDEWREAFSMFPDLHELKATSSGFSFLAKARVPWSTAELADAPLHVMLPRPSHKPELLVTLDREALLRREHRVPLTEYRAAFHELGSTLRFNAPDKPEDGVNWMSLQVLNPDGPPKFHWLLARENNATTSVLRLERGETLLSFSDQRLGGKVPARSVMTTDPVVTLSKRHADLVITLDNFRPHSAAVDLQQIPPAFNLRVAIDELSWAPNISLNSLYEQARQQLQVGLRWEGSRLYWLHGRQMTWPQHILLEMLKDGHPYLADPIDSLMANSPVFVELNWPSNHTPPLALFPRLRLRNRELRLCGLTLDAVWREQIAAWKARLPASLATRLDGLVDKLDQHEIAEYQALRDDDRVAESLTWNTVETVYDANWTAGFLREVYGEDFPDPDDVGPAGFDHYRVEPPLLWGNVPLEDGWAMTPVLNITPEIYARIIQCPPREPEEPLCNGVMAVGNDDERLWTARPEQQRWSVSLRDADAIVGSLRFARRGGEWQLASAAIEFHLPELIFNGFYWLARCAPSAADALPQMEVWPAALHSITLHTPRGSIDPFPSPYVLRFDGGSVVKDTLLDLPANGTQKAEGQVGATLNAWSFEILANASHDAQVNCLLNDDHPTLPLPTGPLAHKVEITRYGRIAWRGGKPTEQQRDALTRWNNPSVYGPRFCAAVREILERLAVAPELLSELILSEFPAEEKHPARIPDLLKPNVAIDVRCCVTRVDGESLDSAGVSMLREWSTDAALPSGFREAAWRIVDAYDRLLSHSFYAGQAAFQDRPLVWRRHPSLPAIQSLPMTQTLKPANYPSASRQLVPFELPFEEEFEGLGQVEVPAMLAPRPRDWRFGCTHQSAASHWPRVVPDLSPAREWLGYPAPDTKDPRHDGYRFLRLALLSLPGLAAYAAEKGVAATVAAIDFRGFLPYQYSFGLPYLDEVYSLAELPRAGSVEDEASGAGADEAGEGSLPPSPLNRSTFESAWGELAALGLLAAADADYALDGTSSSATVRSLIEPLLWQVEPRLFLRRYPGKLWLCDGGRSLVLTRERALRGFHGYFERRSPTSPEIRLIEDPGEYEIIAGSMAAVVTGEPENLALRDQRGLLRWRSDDASANYVRTPVELLDGDPVVLTTLKQSVPLLLGASVQWNLWFRDLPVQEGFQRRRSPSNEDVNDPDADTKAFGHLEGYEWRLGIEGRSHFDPVSFAITLDPGAAFSFEHTDESWDLEVPDARVWLTVLSVEPDANDRVVLELPGEILSPTSLRIEIPYGATGGLAGHYNYYISLTSRSGKTSLIGSPENPRQLVLPATHQIGPLGFFPLTLERVDFEGESISRVQIRGRLQLPLPGDVRGAIVRQREDLANIVLLTFTRQDGGPLNWTETALDDRPGAPRDLNWPLADAPGSPRLCIRSITAPHAGEILLDQCTVDFELYQRPFSVSLLPFRLPLQATAGVTVNATVDTTGTVKIEALKLTLDLTEYQHRLALVIVARWSHPPAANVSVAPAIVVRSVYVLVGQDQPPCEVLLECGNAHLSIPIVPRPAGLLGPPLPKVAGTLLEGRLVIDDASSPCTITWLGDSPSPLEKELLQLWRDNHDYAPTFRAGLTSLLEDRLERPFTCRGPVKDPANTVLADQMTVTGVGFDRLVHWHPLALTGTEELKAAKRRLLHEWRDDATLDPSFSDVMRAIAAMVGGTLRIEFDERELQVTDVGSRERRIEASWDQIELPPSFAVLPGMIVDRGESQLASVPGFAALSFDLAAEPSGTGFPQFVVRTGMAEMLFHCKWGQSLQQELMRSGMGEPWEDEDAVFGSSAGDVDIDWIIRFNPPGSPTETTAELRISGMIEVKNIISWPLRTRCSPLDEGTVEDQPYDLPALPHDGTFHHRRHTARMLWNQVVIAGDRLVAAQFHDPDPLVLYTLGPEESHSLQFCTVVEHQFVDLEMVPQRGNELQHQVVPRVARIHREMRWSLTQEVRVASPRAVSDFLESVHGNDHLTENLAEVGTLQPVEDCSKSYLKGSCVSGLRSELLHADFINSALVVELSTVVAAAARVLAQEQVGGYAPLQRRPTGVDRGIPSSWNDYATVQERESDMLVSPWTIATIPFLGRLQVDRDPHSVSSRLRADPIRTLAAGVATGSSLALLLDLTSRTVGTAAQLEVARFDVASKQQFARVDPATLEEQWCRLVFAASDGTMRRHSTSGTSVRAEPAGGVLESMPSTGHGRLSQPQVLEVLLDPYRTALPPERQAVGPPASLESLAWRYGGLLAPQFIGRRRSGSNASSSFFGFGKRLDVLVRAVFPGAELELRRIPAVNLLAPAMETETRLTHPVSFAISPYLGLEHLSIEPDPEGTLLALYADLLVADAQRGSMIVLESRLWQKACDESQNDLNQDSNDPVDPVEGKMPTDGEVVDWAREVHARLAADSSLLVLRVRKVVASRTVGEVSLAYVFTVLLPQADRPRVSRAQPLRGEPRRLGFREGQYCGLRLPPQIRAFEISPPRVADVRPLYLESPPIQDPLDEPKESLHWHWGISGLRFEAQVTKNGRGWIQRPFSALVNRNLWWQGCQHLVQFAKPPREGQSLLPAMFRVRQIRSLVPVLPDLPLPSRDEVNAILMSPKLAPRQSSGDTRAAPGNFLWQAVLSGAWTWLTIGGRAGAYFSFRQQLLSQQTLDATRSALVNSGAIPVQHRFPRPVAIPANEFNGQGWALETWDNYYSLQKPFEAVVGEGAIPDRPVRVTIKSDGGVCEPIELQTTADATGKWSAVIGWQGMPVDSYHITAVDNLGSPIETFAPKVFSVFGRIASVDPRRPPHGELFASVLSIAQGVDLEMLPLVGREPATVRSAWTVPSSATAPRLLVRFRVQASDPETPWQLSRSSLALYVAGQTFLFQRLNDPDVPPGEVHFHCDPDLQIEPSVPNVSDPLPRQVDVISSLVGSLDHGEAFSWRLEVPYEPRTGFDENTRLLVAAADTQHITAHQRDDEWPVLSTTPGATPVELRVKRDVTGPVLKSISFVVADPQTVEATLSAETLGLSGGNYRYEVYATVDTDSVSREVLLFCGLLQVAISGYRQKLTFTTRLLRDGVAPLPVVPVFAGFEDPDYSRRLSSRPQRRVRECALHARSAANAVQTATISLAIDRSEYNPATPVYVAFGGPPNLPGQALLRVARVRLGITEDIIARPVSVNTIECIELPLVEHATAKAKTALLPGDDLEVTIENQEDSPVFADGESVTVSARIIAEPVNPPPQAAYALLRSDARPSGTPRKSVQCVRFAWAPEAARIDLTDPADLFSDVVRRRAVFQWVDYVRAQRVYRYAVQKVCDNGSTRIPRLNQFVSPPLFPPANGS